ncbi:hypothetical protein CBI38_13275 [Rhodococcus oxybenzonivorans]|uniref:DUF881 domain-containing protein n=1 Tax=Rhodococcus oxybenzonivorans TaxID=1990687 RepID=A0A2S2BUT4_9NOCA|nr:DUF881 domain-containing protein [Rhodococcus oxybenzonivorans]AWK72405.1 hypothetical protein CBI38_13275 [Rhodococcus oxybenzonivorans]
MKRIDTGVRRNPVPSLLRSLMNDHLDPGYEGAAEDREHGHARQTRWGNRVWISLGALLIGLVLAVAYRQATERLPGTEQVRAELLGKVHDAEARVGSLEDTRDGLSVRTDDARAAALAGDARGAAVLAELRALEGDAAVEAVRGPGLTVTLTDPAARPNLSDSSQRSVGGKAVVLDRDLQSVVNSLWASGAEAVAVGDVRIGPTVTIRQAGGAMLVDNQPVFSPYVVSAIGPQRPMQTGFVVSDAYLRMSSIAQLYGIGFSVAEADELDLPAAPAREVRSAQVAGTR